MNKLTLHGLALCLSPLLSWAAAAAPPPTGVTSQAPQQTQQQKQQLLPQATPRQVYTPPVIVQPATDFIAITAGNYHTCALQRGGKVYCWGGNGAGQTATGGGTTWCGACVDRPTFNRVMANQIAAGADHTCTILNGQAQCWGSAASGQIGNGTTGSTLTSGPQPVSGGLAFTKIAAGANTTCGVSNLSVLCWGELPGLPNNFPSAGTPLLVANVPGPINTIATGAGYTCFVIATAQGMACWGRNGAGQVGAAASVSAPLTAVVPITPGGVAGVWADSATTCFAAPTGPLDCIGFGEHGNLGNGQLGMGKDFSTAQPVSGLPNFSRALNSVSVGGDHVCALDTSGAAWCWGYGDHGELGNGSARLPNAPAVEFANPQRVAGNHVFRAIAAGGFHTCAIDTVNQIYCWGDDSRGQLGTGGVPGIVPTATGPLVN